MTNLKCPHCNFTYANMVDVPHGLPQSGTMTCGNCGRGFVYMLGIITSSAPVDRPFTLQTAGGNSPATSKGKGEGILNQPTTPTTGGDDE